MAPDPAITPAADDGQDSGADAAAPKFGTVDDTTIPSTARRRMLRGLDGSGPDDATLPRAAAATVAFSGTRACLHCGGVIAADDYCSQCGAVAEKERDHFVRATGPDLGGVCNRGVAHHRNEDALALARQGDVAMLVVCDGVSSAPVSDVASMAAVDAALSFLQQGAPGGPEEIVGEPLTRTKNWAARLVTAASRANAAVLQVPPEGENSPSCTFVAAVVDGARAIVAWVGDSRAYWIPDQGLVQQLTHDDSWAQEMIDLGHPAAQISQAPHAHAITNWLGADAPDREPRTDTTVMDRPGWLLLCTDGLWNYAPDPADLAEVLRAYADAPGAGTTAVGLATAMVSWANSQGGRDNVTVALLRWDPPASLGVVTE
ncbi:MAG: PP2C family protein-serine/threonine phosphatase [Beutenbergiaceae bacterium]